MKTFKYLFTAVVGLLAVSCYEMDILPKDTTNESIILSSPSGVKQYFAIAYHDLPIEDFNYYNGKDGKEEGYARVGQSNQWNAQKNSLAAAAGEASGRNTEYKDYDYWTTGEWQGNSPWYRIRHLNSFIASFPNYMSNFKEEEALGYMAEAHFLRAFYYFGLVKRYGGVPIIKDPQDPKAPAEVLELPRSTEYESWKFIHDDLQYAMENGWDNGKEKPNETGRANRYAAAALMTRAMLYAGTVAKYTGSLKLSGPSAQAGLQGMPVEKAAEFFQYVCDAAQFIKDRGYRLHTNATDKALGFAEVFTNPETEEDIFIKQYGVVMRDGGTQNGAYLCHSWDGMILPKGDGMVVKSPGAALHPAWDLLKLYEMPAITDGDGKPVRFNTREELWQSDKMEARARGTFYFSGMKESLSGNTFDIQAGVYKSYPLSAADGTAETSFSTNEYTALYRIRAEGDKLGYFQNVNGREVKINGVHGPKGGGDEGYAYSGVFIRKYVSNNPMYRTDLHQSLQPWKVFRYGEVLLNWAEAAYELSLANESIALRDKAFDLIDELRVRAGASLHAWDKSSKPTDVGMLAVEAGGLGYGLSIDANLAFIRDERARELAFENHRMFDLIRWRIADKMFAGGVVLRGMYPYYVIDENKYIFLNEVGIDMRKVKFEEKKYYNQIPGVALNKNRKLIRNDGY